ncbi:hypothetical protein [Streptomyces sp. NPDC052042]|uniref:hypothetical protein n=1 Tax=Streptomyces sp. NPDC052042 TaxID=3365683 RepID=UPI0037D3877F
MRGPDALATRAPVGRPVESDEVAETIAYPAGDAVSFVHGVVMPVGGGHTVV